MMLQRYAVLLIFAMCSHTILGISVVFLILVKLLVCVRTQITVSICWVYASPIPECVI